MRMFLSNQMKRSRSIAVILFLFILFVVNIMVFVHVKTFVYPIHVLHNVFILIWMTAHFLLLLLFIHSVYLLDWSVYHFHFIWKESSQFSVFIYTKHLCSITFSVYLFIEMAGKESQHTYSLCVQEFQIFTHTYTYHTLIMNEQTHRSMVVFLHFMKGK